MEGPITWKTWQRYRRYVDYLLANQGGEGIDTIVAGDGIEVDNTDPSNPIVSNTDIIDSSTLLPLTGTGTATGSVGGNIGNNQFRIYSSYHPNGGIFYNGSTIRIGDMAPDHNETEVYIDDNAMRISLTAQAQITLNGPTLIGTGTISSSASLQINSASTGLLIPRMSATEASAIASPAEGLMIYVTDTNGTFLVKGWWGYNGATWQSL